MTEMDPQEYSTVFGKVTKTSKVVRYGWTIKDTPGVMRYIHKKALQIHPEYQRKLVHSKAKKMATEWSWIACGALVVGLRDGVYWVVDGQHRAIALMMRADIELVPCIVFETESVEQEAAGFLDANTARKPLSSLDRFKASLAAGDEVTAFVQSVADSCGIELTRSPHKARQMKALGWAMQRAREDREAFVAVMRTASVLCADSVIHETILDGLYYIHGRVAGGLHNKRLRYRILLAGPAKLLDGARRAAAFYLHGGGKAWAAGMMEVVNKGLRDKIVYEGDSAVAEQEPAP